MLASTIQFSHNTPHTPTTTTQQQSTCRITRQQQLLPQTPNSAPMTSNTYFFNHTNPQSHTAHPHPTHNNVCDDTTGVSPPGNKNIGSHTHGDSTNNNSPQLWANKKLLRKEVIQPHLPVRLPCYDFVPIADPTFDSSHNRPLASGVTNFHDVTGGVYKARERIHRSVADLRLLATPTSWGRVADPNPN